MRLYSRHLKHFLAVYETRSLRRAAEISGVTQPALSKSLRVLESTFSVSLFERHATGVVPTQAAAVLRRHAQHIVNSSRYVEMEIAMLRDGRAGTLRVGSGIVWSASRMPQLVAQLHSRFPQLDLALYTGIAEQLIPRLLNGDLDVVFASLPREPLPPGFTTVRLPDTGMVVFGRDRHALARRRSVDLKDLGSFDFVGFAEDHEAQRQSAAAFGTAGLAAPRTVVHSSSLETLIATVAASDCLAILPELLSARAAAAGLVKLHLPAPLWRIQMGIVYHERISGVAPFQELLRLAGT